MAYNYDYPYTNSDRYNADWLLSAYQRIIAWIEGTAESDIKELILSEFNNLMLNAIYDENNKCIILYREEKNNG